MPSRRKSSGRSSACPSMTRALQSGSVRPSASKRRRSRATMPGERSVASTGESAAVEHLGGHGDFALLGMQQAGAQLRSNDRLVSADRRLRETAPAVTGRSLPGQAALLGDELDVAIALPWRLGTLHAWHRRGRWRNDGVRRGIGLVTGDGLVHRFALVRTIRSHGRNLAFNRLEQRLQLTAIIGGIVDQQMRWRRAVLCLKGIPESLTAWPQSGYSPRLPAPSVDAPFRARENFRIAVTRSRMLPSVRPLSRSRTAGLHGSSRIGSRSTRRTQGTLVHTGFPDPVSPTVAPCSPCARPTPR